jgi:hypothetical protein
MYDITIKRGPKGSNPLYGVLGTPNKRNLNTEEKQAVKAFLERVDIKKFTQPLTPEEVREKIGTVDEPPRVAVGHNTVEVGTKDSPAGVVPPDDSEFDFGDDE